MHSDATNSSLPRFVPWRHWPTLLAVVVALVGRPLVYTLVDPEPVLGPLGGSQGRRPWWLFQCWILLFQWIPFAIAWVALRRSNRSWVAYGIDWSWFRRQRTILATAAIALGVLAIAAPRYWYGTTAPLSSRTFVLLPVTAAERLFFLVACVSAGVCEETCYRGLPLRGMAGPVGALAMLPVTIVSFVFVHGWFGLHHAGGYASIGFLFGASFIMLGRRHLEWLVVAHAVIDAMLVAAP